MPIEEIPEGFPSLGAGRSGIAVRPAYAIEVIIDPRGMQGTRCEDREPSTGAKQNHPKDYFPQFQSGAAYLV